MKARRETVERAVEQTVNSRFALNPVAMTVLSFIAVTAQFGAMSNALASETDKSVAFDTTFLQMDGKDHVDVTRFEHGNVVSPGTYSVDVIVNDARVAREDVRFETREGSESAVPCLTRKLLERAGFDFTKFEADHKDVAVSQDLNACIDLRAIAPESSIDFDFNEQKLNISIPQTYMRNMARGYVSPELWDQGVNAGFLSYNANAYETNGDGVHTTQTYLGLNGGVNVGGWHFRHQGSLTTSTGQSAQYDNIATYAQHDIPKYKAQATIGDAQTTGDVFDSVSFRGAQIATDDRMLPESLRGFAPVVRGTADTNARVTVRQNGQVIYETNVSPGPFEIKDLYATGSGGNLDVMVTEADGRTKSFTVPYASIAQSLRPGTTRFAVTAGQLRDDSLHDKPYFTQFTVQRGLTNSVTLYGGAIAAQGYLAANFGAALNTKFGAFAADLTAARTEVPGHQTMQGKSLHIGYSKVVDATNTNLSVAAYRYSDSGYLNFSDAAHARDIAMNGGDLSDRQRGRAQLTINQPLANHGSVFASASAQTYWNRPGRDVFFQAGYSNSFKYGTYSLTAGRTANSDGSMSNEIMLSTTIPLGHSQHAPQLTSNVNVASSGASVQDSISGTAGASNQYSYNVYGTASKNNGSDFSMNAGASGTYRAPYAQVSASASGGQNSSQVSMGVSGSIVAHPGGVSLSQTVGDTFGIVEAKGAEGAALSSVSGAKVDSHGYAVVPYLTPYSMNTVDIDPKGSSTDVEFDSTSNQSAPHAGSIVMLKYKTATGRAALIHAPRMDGEALPFGAEVTDWDGHVVGVVAQDSRIFARGVTDSGKLMVKWGDQPGEACRVSYELPQKEGQSAQAYTTVETHCLTEATAAVANAASEQGKAASAN